MNGPGEYIRTLVVFVQFSGDTRTDDDWPLNSLPTWADQANKFIATSPSSNYPDMTVSDYWKQMAQGNYDFIGEVYPNLVTLPPESQYQSQGKNYSHANQDVLAIINTNVNWINYDKWSYNTQTQSFQFTPDGFVDMIYIIYRNPGEYPYPNWFGNFSAIANLSNFSYDYVTHDGKTIRARYYPTKESTGITFRVGMTAGHAGMIGLNAHEFGHYIFGAVHWNAGAGGIMGGYTFAMSGWERERVGYIAYTDVTQDNFTAVLGDFISEGDILKIPVSSSNYFLVENHQRLSHYDQIKQGGTNPGFQWNTLGAGIYIWKVTNGSSGNPTFDMVTADGRFDWEYIGDFWAGPGFYIGYSWEGWVPKTKRITVNRNSGKTDRYPLHIFWNNHWAAKWCDTDGYGNWWLSRNVMGNETDAFNLGYNEIFSNWSNPSSYFGSTTNIALQVYSKLGTNITVKAFTTSNSAQNLPPSKPQWLKVQVSQNNHPYLTWDANQEPDVLSGGSYKVEKYISEDVPWFQLTQTTNTYYEDLSETICVPSPGQQCATGHWVRYRVKAVDNTQLVSVPSDSVMQLVSGGAPHKISTDIPKIEKPTDYSLMQNYPNPFNPTTTFSYSIPMNGFVTLKVYDILGIEVNELVNEVKEAGNYSVTFDASGLPSGIYFYTLTSGNYMATKKLILLK